MSYSMKQARVGANNGKGYTQQECADKLNVHLNTYRNWEEDGSKMPIKAAESFAELVGLSIELISFCPESRN